MKAIPLLLVSDSPECPSGLARITRDLAGKIYKSSLPFRVGTAGFNGHGSQDFPWQQYSLGPFATSSDIPKLLHAWLDFSKGEKGIILCIYDLQRLESFRFSQHYGGNWAAYLGQKEAPFFLGGYIPVDSHSPKGMTAQSAEILRAFDFVIAYGDYGHTILDRARQTLSNDLPKPAMIHKAPHGLDISTFCQQPIGGGRARLQRQIPTDLKDSEGKPITRLLSVMPEDKLLGVVGTNQMRKDWGAAAEIAAKLPGDWKFWWHTDRLLNWWSIPDLIQQYDLGERVFVTMGLDDQALSELYSDCDATFALGRGEGFGFPIVESMACGTPTVHTAYAGGADLLPEEMLVPPLALSPEGPYCLQRPILDVDEIVRKVQNIDRQVWSREACQTWAHERYGWPGLWKREWIPVLEDLASSFKTWRGKDK